MELSKEEIQAKMREWKQRSASDEDATDNWRPQAIAEVEYWKQRALQEEAKLVELRERQRRQFSALFGPYVSGDYSIGDKIRVRLRPQPPEDEFSGVILWSYGPGETPVSHRHHPLTYVVDAGRGMPVLVYPTEIVP